MPVFRGALRIVRAVSVKEVFGKRFVRKTAGYFHPVFKIITERRGRKNT